MHYYQHNCGEFALETKHMTFEQKGIYIDMLDQYATSGKPLDSHWVATLRKVASEDAVETVLSLCFTEDEGVYRHARMDELLEAYAKTTEKNRKNAAKRSKASQSQASGNPVASQSQASGEPNHKPITNNQEPLTKNQCLEESSNEDSSAPPPPRAAPAPRKRAAPFPRPEQVTPQHWDDWQAVRKAKKAPMTQSVLDAMIREAEKAGITLDQAVAICAERNWQAFRASYDWKDHPKQTTIDSEYLKNPACGQDKDYGTSGMGWD